MFLFKLSVKRRFRRDGANLGCSSPRIRDILYLPSICLSNQRFFLDLMLLIGISVVRSDWEDDDFAAERCLCYRISILRKIIVLFYFNLYLLLVFLK